MAPEDERTPAPPRPPSMRHPDDGDVEEFSERTYRRLVEQMREGAVMVSAQTDTICYCNRSFSRMVELPASRVRGSSLRRWLEPVDGPSIERLLREHAPLRGDYRLDSARGNTLPVSASATTVRDGDRTLRCLIVNDLRVRRDVERLQQARAELELSHVRKNEFLAMLGHELRNPLAPVKQAVELLEASAEATDPEYLVKARSVLTRHTLHLKRLVDDLLDVGRVTQGTLTIERQPVDLRVAIRTARESAERLLARRRHRVRVDLPPSPMMVDGDTVRLTQVFANLISNAAKYTPDDGRVDIIGTRKAHGHVVSVVDDGRGLEPEIIPYLFEPFVQSEATLDRSAGGIGVGLTLVRRIVELHDGRVSAYSRGAGRGSEFRVWLPLATIAAAEHQRSDVVRGEAMSTPSARRILVVDDNEDAAEMLALVLRKRGYEVELAFDGEEALERAAASGPEIVLLDIGLPGIDGYEVARQLRARSRTARCIVVALTGYSQPEDRERSLEAGFDDHLVKPVTIEALLGVFQPVRPER